MTEQSFTPTEEPLEIPDDDEPEQVDIPLERCNLTFVLNMTDVKSLDEAINTAAMTVGRYGLDSLYVLAIDPDTGREWFVRNGKVYPADEQTAEAIRQAGDE